MREEPQENFALSQKHFETSPPPSWLLSYGPASKHYLWGSLKFLVHPKDRVASEVHQITQHTHTAVAVVTRGTQGQKGSCYGQRLLFCLLKCDPPTVRSCFSHIWKKRNKDRPVTGITCRGGK